MLSKDSDDLVRWYIAKNQNTPISLLKILKNDDQKFVRKAAKNELKIRCEKYK